MNNHWENFVAPSKRKGGDSTWQMKTHHADREIPQLSLPEEDFHPGLSFIDFLAINTNRCEIYLGLNIYDTCQELAYLQSSADWLQSILDRPEDWDEAGAVKASPSSATNALRFLVEYAEALINSGVDRRKILPPEINSRGTDGTIDFYWELDQVKLMINFTSLQGRPIAAFFGMFANRTKPIEGWVFVDESPNPFFVEWLANVST